MAENVQADASSAQGNGPGKSPQHRYSATRLRALIVQIRPRWEAESAEIDVTFVIDASHMQVDRTMTTEVSIPWGEDDDNAVLRPDLGSCVVVQDPRISSLAPPVPDGGDRSMVSNHDCLGLPALLSEIKSSVSYQVIIPKETDTRPGMTFPIESHFRLSEETPPHEYVLLRYKVLRKPTLLFQVSRGYFNSLVNLFHWADADPMLCDYLVMEVIYPEWKPRKWSFLVRRLARFLDLFESTEERDPLVRFATLDRPDHQSVLHRRGPKSFIIGLAGVTPHQRLVLTMTYTQDILTTTSMIHAVLLVLYVWVLGHYVMEFGWATAVAISHELGHELPEGAATQSSSWSAGTRILFILGAKAGLLFVGFLLLLLSLWVLRMIERRMSTRSRKAVTSDAPPPSAPSPPA
jgi:hypothetical protein